MSVKDVYTIHLLGCCFICNLCFFQISKESLCILRYRWTNCETLSPFSMWCSVAFSKICPAGKGYLYQNIRESVAFPPIIFPRKPDKEGESEMCTAQDFSQVSSIFQPVVHANTQLILSMCLSFFSLPEPKRPVRHYFIVVNTMIMAGSFWGVVRSDSLFGSGEATRENHHRAGSHHHQQSSCSR